MFVVLFFAFLIYFIYGQQQFTWRVTSDATQQQVPDIDALRRGQQTGITVDAPTTTSPTVVTTQANPTTTSVPTPTITESPIVTTDSAVLARYNPRTEETTRLKGRELLDRYFSSIATGDYLTACSLLSNTICNARRDIYSFSQFLNKTDGGYQVKSITLAPEQKPTEAIYCVEYTYTLKADLNPQPVTEYFQYRIQSRPDGGDEISARVCEKVIKDGRERSCPIITPKKYCG